MKVSTDACLFGAWIAEQIRPDLDAQIRALDIGGGTGLLSLMLAQVLPNIQITCLEINEEAAKQAAENISHSPWSERIQVVNGDIRQTTDRHRYDLIVSNPPFYERDLNSPDSNKNQAHHDATLNLEDLLESIDRLLTNEGRFFLLLPARKIENRIEAIHQKGFTLYRQVGIRHAADHPVKRYFLAGGRVSQPEELTTQMMLMDEKDQYSEAVRALLADYYLMF